MNILFLDIDGPMIPTSMFLFDRNASYKRIFSPIAIKCVNFLCEKTNTKIVTNTTHNIEFNPDNYGDCDWDKRPIKESLISAGIDINYFHTDSKTKYPSYRRPEAIESWLRDHNDIDNFFAFDDFKFTDEKYLIWINPDEGVHLGHVEKAFRLLNMEREFPIIHM